MPLTQIAALAIAAVGVVVAVWLLIKGAGGQPRVLGMIGTALMLLGTLARFAFQWIAARYLGEVDTEALVTILAAVTVVGGVLTGAGLLVVTRALVVASAGPRLAVAHQRRPRRA